MPSIAPASHTPAAQVHASGPRSVLPGLLLSLLVGAATVLLVRVVPAASPALVAILLGGLAANLDLLRPPLSPGLAVSSRTVLRIGIVLLGLQLAIGDVIALGPATILVIVLVVAIGIGSGIVLGRILRIPAPLALLIACGFSICGAAAVAAAGGALSAAGSARRSLREDAEGTDALETQTATAVALVVVFGTLMIPLVPLLASLLELSAPEAGTWAGASILEVAQVVAAGSLLGGSALDAAVVVKLGRVLLLAPVIALITLSLGRGLASSAEGSHGAPVPRRSLPPLVPTFVLGFLIAVILRSTGVIPQPVLDGAAILQAVLLAAAMFALGTGVRLELLRRVGGRPVLLALLLALIVLAVGLAGSVLAA